MINSTTPNDAGEFSDHIFIGHSQAQDRHVDVLCERSLSFEQASGPGQVFSIPSFRHARPYLSGVTHQEAA